MKQPSAGVTTSSEGPQIIAVHGKSVNA
jgi:hypothetical protein